MTLARVRKVISGCGIEALSGINEQAVQAYLDELREDDLGHRTYNHYAQAFDGFCNWLVSSKRLPFNPVSNLNRLNTEVNVRHPRRALTVREVAKLVNSARESGKSIQCFDGEQRAENLHHFLSDRLPAE